MVLEEILALWLPVVAGSGGRSITLFIINAGNPVFNATGGSVDQLWRGNGGAGDQVLYGNIALLN